jgi:hypothetical protein
MKVAASIKIKDVFLACWALVMTIFAVPIACWAKDYCFCRQSCMDGIFSRS